MKKLTIENIGPIKHVELDLKQVNVIIGPQGSGKSCILKIASFCAWVEKQVLLDMSFNCLHKEGFIENELINFHKLKGLVTEDSNIHYQSDFIEFAFSEIFYFHEFKNKQWEYKLSRVSYIPAERNIISVVPNIFEINFGKDYIKNFVSDWSQARKYFSNNSPLPIVDLPVCYHFDDSKNEDIIDIPNSESIQLTNASSGIQSLVPMCSYLNYLFDNQYHSSSLSSANEDSRNLSLSIRLFHGKFGGYKKDEDKGLHAKLLFREIGPSVFPFISEKEYQECLQIFKNFTEVDHSDIFLEEPELNIFPLTQVSLVNFLLEKIKAHDDNLFIATHSHYILYALNNCMLGHKVATNAIGAGDEEIMKNQKSWIDPAKVGVWELRDGKLSSVKESPSNTIQDEDGLIRGNYFDRVMHNVMADFTNLMNYYE